MKSGSTTNLIRHSKKHTEDIISSGSQTQKVMYEGKKFHETILKVKLI